MTIQPGVPPVPGKGAAPGPVAPGPKHQTEEKKISSALFKSITSLYKTPQAVQPRVLPLKRLTTTQQKQLAQKIAAAAVQSGLTHTDVEELLRSGTLDLETFIENEALIDLYAANIDRALQNLQQAGAMAVPGISRNSVIHVITAAFKSEVMHAKGAVITTPTGDFLVRLKKKQAHVYAIPVASKQELGRGAFSVAYKVNDILSNQNVVFKAIEPQKPENLNKSIKEAIHEIKVLKEVHAYGVVEGIKPPPHAVVSLISGKGGRSAGAVAGTSMQGSIDILYEGDLFHLVGGQWKKDWKSGNKHMDQRVAICSRLLDGLASLHAVGRSHGDLKLQNFLYRTENNQVIADIADFGSSLSITEVDERLKDQINFPKFRKQPWGTITSAFVCPDDLKLEKDAIKSRSFDELILIQQQRDVFSLAFSLVYLLTNKYPFNIYEYVSYDINNNEIKKYEPDLSDPLYPDAFDAVFDPSTSYDLKKLFESLLNPDITQRYPAVDALDALTQFTSKPSFRVL